MSGLNQQFAKLRAGESWPEGSNPSLSTKLMWVCSERRGVGLQIRIMQVRVLSPTPELGDVSEWSMALK